MTVAVRTAIWTAEITVWDYIAAATTTLKVASGTNFLVSGGTPAAAGFRFVLEQPVVASRSAFGGNRTSGPGQTTTGRMVLRNNEGVLDGWRNYGFDGRTVLFKIVAPGTEWTTLSEPAGEYTMDGALISQDSIEISLVDWQRSLEVPIQANVYAGSGGLAGGDDVKGQARPFCVGRPRNVTPKLVVPTKGIYEVSDELLQSIDVFDGGQQLAVGLDWTERTCAFSTGIVWDVQYNGSNLWVVVGDTGQLSTSPDGVTWTSRTSSFSTTKISGVAYGGGVWVAVGDAGKLASSTDGITWTQRTSQFTADNIRRVAHDGSGLFVAVGAAGKLSTSPDGVTWTSRTSGFGSTNIRCVTCGVVDGANRWVIGGEAGKVSTSPNGTTWTARNTPLPTTANDFFDAVCAGGPTRSQFILSMSQVVAPFARLVESGDAINWTERSSGLVSSLVLQIAYGAGLWMLIATPSFAGSVVATSRDGKVWTSVNAVATLSTNFGLGFGQNQFIFTGTNAGNSRVATTTAAAAAYANSTDLLDDTLQPALGTYKVFLNSAGSYFRLRSPPQFVITCDPVQGANAAARTIAQLSVKIIDERAGFTSGDWSASDVTTLDAAFPGEAAYYTTSGDRETCAAVIAKLLGSGLAYINTDMAGVLRLKQLSPIQNLIQNPDKVASSPWQIGGGSPVATNNVGTFGDRSFSRITSMTSGPIIQPLTLPGNGTYTIRGYLKSNGVTGALKWAILYDSITADERGLLTSTVASDGTISTAIGGTTGVLVRTVPLWDGVYAFELTATVINFANVHYLYAEHSVALASALFSGFELLRGVADLVLTQSADMRGMSEAQSGDDSGGLPPYRCQLSYSKNYTPLVADQIAGSVSQASAQLLMNENLIASTTPDAAILAAHPLAPLRSEESCLVSSSDAVTEVTRRQALFGIVGGRRWYTVPVEVNDNTFPTELGDIVDLVTNRFGMGAGARGVILGIQPDIANGILTLAVFV